ncbi:FMN-binding protein [Gorillibacterium sp. sgz5001074]|uniref:FMN-binding protein n=1 Tax=Gorillibacterium sp. sgz5001074 TaxID=3446695 RepID=UPI003F668A0A
MLKILLGITAVTVTGLAIGWPFLSREHREARNLPIGNIDFSKLKDGTYIGKYEGGMYKWRANEVKVTVSKGKVTRIELLMHKENQSATFTGQLYGRVIHAQSLQVDTISGATLTSKAYLKSVEIALSHNPKG